MSWMSPLPQKFSGKNRGLIEIPVPRIVILVTEPASWGCAALPSPQAESGSWVQTIKRYKRLGTTLVALQAPFVSKIDLVVKDVCWIWLIDEGFVMRWFHRVSCFLSNHFYSIVVSSPLVCTCQTCWKLSEDIAYFTYFTELCTIYLCMISSTILYCLTLFFTIPLYPASVAFVSFVDLTKR